MKIYWSVLTIAVSCLTGCVGKHPYLSVQLCLENRENTEKFIKVMRSIAAENQMRYIDRSAATQQELATLGKDPGFQVMNISAVGPDNVGWAAGNTGLSEFEISMGFSEGNNPGEARRIAEEIIDRLSAEWKVERLPPNQGASNACK